MSGDVFTYHVFDVMTYDQNHPTRNDSPMIQLGIYMSGFMKMMLKTAISL